MMSVIKKMLPGIAVIAVTIGVVAVPIQPASAIGYNCPCLIAYGHDLTGDGIADIVYDDGYGSIYIQSSTGYKYQSYNIPNRTSLTIQHGVDSYAGNEIVVTDVWNDLYVIGVNTHWELSLDLFSNPNDLNFSYSELDGYAGEEIVIRYDSNNHTEVLVPRDRTRRHFSSFSHSAAFTFVESDGTPGNEMIMVSQTGGVDVYDTRDSATRTYYVGTGWRNIEFVDLDGVAGKEIVFNWSNNQVRIRDRTYSYY